MYMLSLNFLKKGIALIYFVLLKVIFFPKASLTYPSLTFGFFSFSFYKGSKISIGRRAIIANHTEIICKGNLTIGDNFTLNKYSRVVALKDIWIGDNVTIAQFVSVLDHDHKYEIMNGEMKLDGYTKEPIQIGNNVWIGDKVTICKGVTIGDNIIIGANSVVTKDIESNCIAAGIPCRKVKSL